MLDIILTLLLLTAVLVYLFVSLNKIKTTANFTVYKACASHARECEEGEAKTETLNLPTTIYDKKTLTPIELEKHIIVRVSKTSMEQYGLMDNEIALFKPFDPNLLSIDNIKPDDIILVENDEDPNLEKPLKNPILLRIRKIRNIGSDKKEIHFYPFDKVSANDGGHRVRQYHEVKGIYVNSYIPQVA